MKKDILYLGSKSKSRQRLLDLADIPYKVLTHVSDEQPRQGINAFQEYVLAVAQGKMRALRLPESTKAEEDYIFALTADTLERSPNSSQIFGKPLNREHALKMLRAQRQGPVEVVTACCLEKFYRHDEGWSRGEHMQWVTTTQVEFYVDDASMDTYFKMLPGVMQASGAAMVDEHGLRYLKSINGSYSSVIGLPLYELCENLRKMGFKL